MLRDTQGAITHLSEQISSLHDRMGEFTNRIEELNSKLTIKKNCPSQQNSDSVPTSYFITSLSNGFPSQLAKESHLSDEVCIFSDSIILDAFSTMCDMSTFSQLL